MFILVLASLVVVLVLVELVLVIVLVLASPVLVLVPEGLVIVLVLVLAGLILVFFSFSYIQSRSQLYAANTSSSFAFLQMVLVDGIPLSSCTVYRYFVPFF